MARFAEREDATDGSLADIILLNGFVITYLRVAQSLLPRRVHMKSRLAWMTRHWLRSAVILLALILLAAIVAPFINAAPYAGSIQRALEVSLGRKVSFREAHFSLLFGPGFSLTDVTIEEDPHFGVEPFAYVPTVDVRLRLDRLLLGKVEVSSLHLVEPSLNLVRNDDGSWNMMGLAGRLSQTGGAPVHLFPAIQVTDGRVDFKMGVRKTNIYVADANLSIYGEDPGKLYVQFAGSPARTDRAGNGFGSFSGHFNWYPHPVNAEANQIEGSVTLDQSNLSELSTLFQGEDAGVHAVVSGRARIAGPATALHVAGNLRLEGIHRWDLLPSSGEDWAVAYEGVVNLPARSVDLKTIPRNGTTAPVELAIKGTDFLTHPAWSVLANLNGAPAGELLPLARRMGLDLPDGLTLDGSISGAVSYSTAAGWTGGVGITNFVAAVPNVPPFRATAVNASIEPDRIHLESARLSVNDAGWLDLGGDYDRLSKGLHVALVMDAFPARNLRDLFANWVRWPVALDALQSGSLTGGLDYAWTPSTAPVWTGRFNVVDGSIAVDGLPDPITSAKATVAFDSTQLEVQQFTGSFEKHTLQGSFFHDDTGKRPERVRAVYSGADLADIEKLLLLSRRETWLQRLGVTRYSAPEWLLTRNVQGDFELPNVSLRGSILGDLRSHAHWVGTTVQLTGLRLQMPQGEISGSGTITLAGDAPRYKLDGALTGLPWRGGFLSAQGGLQSSGTGSDLLQHLAAQGTFTGQDVSFSPDDQFDAVSGNFQLSFADGWPDLHLTAVQATDGDEEWTGAAVSNSDGKLMLDLQHDGHQRHVVSTLSSDASTSAAIH